MAPGTAGRREKSKSEEKSRDSVRRKIDGVSLHEEANQGREEGTPPFFPSCYLLALFCVPPSLEHRRLESSTDAENAFLLHIEEIRRVSKM